MAIASEIARLQAEIVRLTQLITEYDTAIAENQSLIDQYANTYAERTEQIERIRRTPPSIIFDLIGRATAQANLTFLTRSRAYHLGRLRWYLGIREGFEALSERARRELALAEEMLKQLLAPVGWEVTKYFTYEPSEIKNWYTQREFEVKGELFFPSYWTAQEVSTYVFTDNETEMEALFDDVLWEALMNNLEKKAIGVERGAIEDASKTAFKVELASHIFNEVTNNVRWGSEEVTSTGQLSSREQASTVDFTVIDKSRYQHYKGRKYTTTRDWTVPE